jgi:FKBP-type peptidyl-prolyl cis-trans isomerase SlyD
MKISKNAVVSVAYELTVEGNVMDKSKDGEPLVFLSGVGAMIPGFESQLQGLAKGESYEISIEPKDGYGEYNHEAIVTLPQDTFKVEGELQKDILFVGNIIPMQDQNGNPMEGEVKEILDTEVKLDFNHKLSGKTLEFVGEIVDVREATTEELEHGHVHGEEGHQH